MILHSTFVLTGIVTTLLGPVLPILVNWWALDDARAGLLFAAQFGGSMLGSVLASLGMTRLGFRGTLVAGAALMGAGVGALGSGVAIIGSIAIFSYGVGLGVTIPTANLFVARAHPATRASALSVLNFAWGLGAVGAPAVVALFQRADNVRLLLWGLAAALMLMAGALARLRDPDPHGVRPGPGDVTSSPGAAVWRASGAWFFGAVLFLYVGTETSVAGWLALYARRLEIIPATLSVATPALFWAALLAGRAAAPGVLRRVPEGRLLGVGLLVATAGVAALMASRSAAVLTVSIIVSGLGLSTVFPLTVAQFTRVMNRAAARAAGPVFVLAGCGGAALPPLVGFVSTTAGSLTAGLVVPLLGCVAMLAVLSVWNVPVADIVA